MSTHRPQDVGILAIEMYFPRRVRRPFSRFFFRQYLTRPSRRVTASPSPNK